jgi:hypothetical protein
MHISKTFSIWWLKVLRWEDFLDHPGEHDRRLEVKFSSSPMFSQAADLRSLPILSEEVVFAADPSRSETLQRSSQPSHT